MHNHIKKRNVVQLQVVIEEIRGEKKKIEILRNRSFVNNYSHHRNHVRIQHEKKSFHSLGITQWTFDRYHISRRNFHDGIHHINWYTNMKSRWNNIFIEAGVDWTTTMNVSLKIKKISYRRKGYDIVLLTFFSAKMSDIPSVMAWRISGCFLYKKIKAGCKLGSFRTKVFWKFVQNCDFKFKMKQ